MREEDLKKERERERKSKMTITFSLVLGVEGKTKKDFGFRRHFMIVFSRHKN